MVIVVVVGVVEVVVASASVGAGGVEGFAGGCSSDGRERAGEKGGRKNASKVDVIDRSGGGVFVLVKTS